MPSTQTTSALSTSELSAAKRALLEARLRGRNRGWPLVGRARRSEAPLSFAQERLWFLDRLQPGSAFYNVPIALRLEGTLDVSALERALSEIVRRHEALRTSFGEGPNGPIQVIAPPRRLNLLVEDLSSRRAT